MKKQLPVEFYASFLPLSRKRQPPRAPWSTVVIQKREGRAEELSSVPAGFSNPHPGILDGGGPLVIMPAKQLGECLTPIFFSNTCSLAPPQETVVEITCGI